jgi:hypothetical protein
MRGKRMLAHSLLLWAITCPAAHAASLCVFDPVGTAGDIYNLSRDYVVAMQRHDVNFELKAYVDEPRAVEDFRRGQCDALFATAFRVREFNPLAASTDTLGVTTVLRNGRIDMASSYEVMRRVVQVFAAQSSKVTKLMANGPYEVAGIFPLGAAYPVVHQRSMNTMEAMRGKRIAALGHDAAQAFFIRRIGAVPVTSDVNNLAKRFASGEVDVIAIPAVGYKPLGIDQAMGGKGGLLRMPLMIVTFQLVVHRDRFSADFPQVSRDFWLTQFDRGLQVVRKAEADIPLVTWIDLSPEEAARTTLKLREARIDIAKQGIYNKQGLKILKRIRCKINPADAQCSTRSEEEWTSPPTNP